MTFALDLSQGIELSCCETESDSGNLKYPFQNLYNPDYFDVLAHQKKFDRNNKYEKSTVSWNEEIYDDCNSYNPMNASYTSRETFEESIKDDLDYNGKMNSFTEIENNLNSNEFMLAQSITAQSPSTFSAALSAPADSSLPFCFSLERPRRKAPKIIAERYLLGETVGRGSYGKVKDGIDLITLRRCAVKIVSKLGVRKIPGGWNQALTEASLLRRLGTHRHIVSVIATFRLSEPDRIVVVMEHCLGSVHDLQSVGVLCLLDTVLPSSEEKEPLSAFHRISTEPFFDQQEQAPVGSPRTNQQAVNDRKRSVCQVKQDQADGFQQFRRLPEAQAHAYFLQVIDGLHYLHCNGIVHRDLKPANLLLTPVPGCGLNPTCYLANEHFQTPFNYSGVYKPGLVPFSPETVISLSRGIIVKLADFGVSTSISSYTPNFEVGGGQTTPAVQPPEVAKGAQTIFNGPMLDVYSAGVSLFFMLTGRVPFSSPNVLQIFEAIAEGFFTIPGYVSAPAANLIRGIMCKDPEKRLSLEGVSRHEWICKRLPPPPPSLATAARACAARWCSDPPVKPQKLRGFPCWLDPFIYLRRPSPQFTAPHIDVTGARIFSLAEIEAMPEASVGFASPPVDRISSPVKTIESNCPEIKEFVTSPTDAMPKKSFHPNSNIVKPRLFSSATTKMISFEDDSWKRRACDAHNSDMIAPMSVTEQLKMYYNWSTDVNFPQESSMYEKNLEDSLACLGIMDYDVPYVEAYNSSEHAYNHESNNLQPFYRPCPDEFVMLPSPAFPSSSANPIKSPYIISRRVRWMSQPSADKFSSQPKIPNSSHSLSVRRRNTASCSLDCQPPLSPDDIPVAESHRTFTIIAGEYTDIRTPSHAHSFSDYLHVQMFSDQLDSPALNSVNQEEQDVLTPIAKSECQLDNVEKRRQKKKSRLHLSSLLRRCKNKEKVSSSHKHIYGEINQSSNHSSSVNDISEGFSLDQSMSRASISSSAVSSLHNADQHSQSSRLRRWFSFIACLRHNFRSNNSEKTHKSIRNPVVQVRSASAMAYTGNNCFKAGTPPSTRLGSSIPSYTYPEISPPSTVIGDCPPIVERIEQNKNQLNDYPREVVHIEKCLWGLPD